MTPLDVLGVAAEGVPVLYVDTCSLLDIMRDPTRDDARAHERRSAVKLVAAVEAGALRCVLAEQVALEFQVHDTAIQEEAEKALRRLAERIERANEIHGVFGTAVSIDTGHLIGQVAAAREVVGRWLAASFLASGSAEVNAKAIARVNGNVAPARKGKDSVKDCIVLETCLTSVAALRAAGTKATIVFLSSNTSEYLNDRKVLKEQIEEDFATFRIEYAPNMSAAMNRLGF